jgi:hypothetical protein
MNNSKTKIFLLISGFSQSIGLYLLIIRYGLDNFKASPVPSDFTPMASVYYNPENEIPLYIGGVLFIPIIGYGIYLLNKYLVRRILPSTQTVISDLNIRLSFLLTIILWFGLIFYKIIPLIIISFLYISIIVLISALQLQFTKKSEAVVSKLSKFIDIFLASIFLIFGALVMFMIFFTKYFSSSDFINIFMDAQLYVFFKGFYWWQFLIVSIIIIIPFTLHFYFARSKFDLLKHKFMNYFIDSIVIISSIIISFFVVPAVLTVRYFAFDYISVIAVINDILGGKTILVDSLSQYGYLMPYVLSILFHFIPLTHLNFFYLNYIITISGYILIYFILRIWFKNYFIPLLWIFLILLNTYFATQSNGIFNCQITFLRWGYWIILLFFLLVKDKLIKNNNYKLFIELLVVDIGVFWAFDLGTFILFSYIGYIIIKNIQDNPNIVSAIKTIFKSILLLCLNLSVFFVIVNIFSYFRSGQFPFWNEFYFHTKLYSSGYGLEKMPIFGHYMFLIFLNLIMVIYIVYTLFEDVNCSVERKKELPLIGFLTLYSLLQFIYYVGESRSNIIEYLMVENIILFCWIIHRCYQIVVKTYVYEINKSEKLALRSIFIVLSILFLIISTVSVLNLINQFPYSKSITSYTKTYFEDWRFTTSVDWLNNYLIDIPPYQRKIALISEPDYNFLFETKSTNIVGSGNIYNYQLYSQFNKLCQQLISNHPDKLFMQSEPGYGFTDIFRGCIKNYYHYSENIGWLDIWEKN